MTPDSFGGFEGDVMSQQPYMWNNNNGLLYDDPSGYMTNPGPGLGWRFPNEGIGGLIIMFNVYADLFIIEGRDHLRERVLCPTNGKDVKSIAVSFGEGIIGSGTFTVDRYGNGYFSGGLAGGVSLPEIGFQVTEGSVLGAPSSGAFPETIYGILTKGSGNIVAVPFYGRTLSTNASGTIVSHAAGTLEASLGASYGIPLGKVAHCK